MAVGKERNNESPCQESALFIDNKASERATWRCDEGKYSASISVRGCLSILDEYKVLRFRLPPSPSRRNKFALARVKRGESPRSAGGRADRRVRGCGGAVRGCGGRAGGKKGEGRIREEMEEANGKRRRKSRARNSRLRWKFSKLPDLLSARHFLPPSRTFPFLIRSPPSALPAALRRAAAHDRVSTAVSNGNACVYKRLCRFHVMRNPSQSCFARRASKRRVRSCLIFIVRKVIPIRFNNMSDRTNNSSLPDVLTIGNYFGKILVVTNPNKVIRLRLYFDYITNNNKKREKENSRWK